MEEELSQREKNEKLVFYSIIHKIKNMVTLSDIDLINTDRMTNSHKLEIIRCFNSSIHIICANVLSIVDER